MRDEFKRDKVKNISKVFSGATPSTNNPVFWNGDILWITPNDLSKLKTQYFTSTERMITEEGLDSCSTHLLPKGTLVMSSRAPIGYLAISESDFTTNQGCKSIVFYENYDSLFFYYNFQSHINKLKALGEGTTFAEISKNYLEEYEISFPESKSEQVKIASILSTTDKAISHTEDLIAKYQRIKTGLMQDLLTRGIDAKGNIRNKATHKFIVKNGIEVPEDWRVECLGDVCSKIQDGTHFSPKTSDDGEFMYLTSKNIRLGYLDLSNVEFINRKQHEEIYRRCAVKFGDVMLTKDGANTGNATVNNIQEQFSLLSSVCIIRGKEDVLNNNFLLSLLLCERGQRLIKDSMSGLAITRVTLQIINKFIFPIPPLHEQIEISNRIQQMENSILIFRKDLDKLQSIKTGLMQNLLGGKVRVK